MSNIVDTIQALLAVAGTCLASRYVSRREYGLATFWALLAIINAIWAA